MILKFSYSKYITIVLLGLLLTSSWVSIFIDSNSPTSNTDSTSELTEKISLNDQTKKEALFSMERDLEDLELLSPENSTYEQNEEDNLTTENSFKESPQLQDVLYFGVTQDVNSIDQLTFSQTSNDYDLTIYFSTNYLNYSLISKNGLVDTFKVRFPEFNRTVPELAEPKLSSLNQYSKIIYRNFLDNIDLEYLITNQGLKYQFIVHPGGNPSLIEFYYDGIQSISLMKMEQEVLIKSINQELFETKLNVYQEINNYRSNVVASYVLQGFNRLGFRFDSYDKNETLIIDPIISPPGPPSIGDWIVSEDKMIIDENLVINGNILINNSAIFTLINSSLILNASTNGEFSISVTDSATFIMQNGSKLSSLFESNRILFQANPGTNITIIDSFLQNFGYAATGVQSGILIKSDIFNFENNSIKDSYFGLFLEGISGENIKINGNQIDTDYRGIHIASSSNVSLENNIINTTTSYGVYMNGANFNIINNNSIFSSTGVTVFLTSSDNNLITRNIINGTGINGYTANLLLGSYSDKNNLTYNSIYTNNAAVAGLRIGELTIDNIAHSNFIHGPSYGQSQYALVNFLYASGHQFFNNTVIHTEGGAGWAISLYGAQNMNITMNHIESAGSGILFWNTDDSIAINNTILANKAFFVVSSRNNNIADNLVDQSGTGILFGVSNYYNTFENNRINVSSVALTIQQTSSNLNNFTGNYFESESTAISLSGSYSNFFFKNEIKAGLWGIEISGSSFNNTFQQNAISGVQSIRMVSGTHTYNKWIKNTILNAFSGLPDLYIYSYGNESAILESDRYIYINSTNSNGSISYNIYGGDSNWIHTDPYRIQIPNVANLQLELLTFDVNNNSRLVYYEYVIENSAPIINGEPQLSLIEGQVNYYLNWSAWDLTNSTYIVYKNSVIIKSGAWNNDENVTWFLNQLSLGIYNYTITFSDGIRISQFTTIVTIIDLTTPIFTQSQNNFSYNEGDTDINLSWKTEDKNPGIYSIFKDGVLVSSGSWDNITMITINIDGLLLGNYNYSIYVNDTSGNEISNFAIIDVVDLNFPIFTGPDDIQYNEGDTGFNFEWELYDNHENLFSIYVNDALISSGTWESTTNITISVDGYLDGIYNFTLIANDTSGNEITDIAILTVVDVNAPIIIDGALEITFIEGTIGNLINWNVTDTHPSNYTLLQNGSIYTAGIWENNVKLEFNISELVQGYYNFTIIISDINGNEVIDTVFISVLNKYPPKILEGPSDIAYYAGSTGNLLNYTVSDVDPTTYILYRNEIITSTGNWASNVSLVFNIDLLVEGIYNFTLLVFDVAGFSSSHTNYVTVGFFPTNGDWVINADLAFDNKFIILNGSLIVTNGANLIIGTSSILFDTATISHSILVNETSYLEIKGDSDVGSLTISNAIYISIYDGSNFIFTDSQLAHIGTSIVTPSQSGIYAQNSEIHLNNATITDTLNGIYISSNSILTVSDSTLEANATTIYSSINSRLIVINSIILSYTATTIYLDASSDDIWINNSTIESVLTTAINIANGAQNFTLINSEINAYEYGVLSGASNTHIENNNIRVVYRDGIKSTGGSNNITRNTIYGRIYISGSTGYNLIISNFIDATSADLNIFSRYGIFLYSNSHNFIFNNSVYAVKAGIYTVNTSYNVIKSNYVLIKEITGLSTEYMGIDMENMFNDNIIKNNYFETAGSAVHLRSIASARNNLFENNTFTRTRDSGDPTIYIVGPNHNNNTFRRNVVIGIYGTYSSTAVKITNSNYAIFEYNILQGYPGLVLENSYFNKFEGNTNTADIGINYVEINPYLLQNNSFIPENANIYFNITANNNTLRYQLNDSALISQLEQDGILVPSGQTISILIMSYDMFNNTFIQTFQFLISSFESEAPQFISTPDSISNITESSTSNKLVWLATDQSPNRFEIYRNSSLISTGFWANGINLTIQIDGLSVGTYIFKLTIYDVFENFNYSSTIIRVLDAINPATYIQRGSIFINGDGSFLTQAASNGWQGDGSIESPIIIYGYNITGFYNGIWIVNTNLHYKISNNYIMGNTNMGILIDNSHNASITGNTLISNLRGIYLSNSNDALITANTISDSIWEGIYFYGASNNIISQNELTKNNSPAIMIKSASNYNSILFNNLTANNVRGITISGSNFNIISYNLIQQNTDDGLSLFSADDNLISYNQFNQSRYSISLDPNSDRNDIKFNSFVNGGFYLVPSINPSQDYNNTLIIKGFNSLLFTLIGTNNTLFYHINQQPWEYVSSPYEIFPSVDGNITLYLRAYSVNGNIRTLKYNLQVESDDGAPKIISSVTETIIEEFIDYSINWTLYDKFSDYYQIYFDGILVETGNYVNGSVIYYLISGKNYGNYNLTIYVFDQLGQYSYNQTLFTLVDISDPIISTPIDQTIEYYSTGNTILWQGSDIHPDTYTVYLDGISFANGSWNSGINLSISIDNLELGIHNITLALIDTSGNLRSDQVNVNVVDTTPPSINNPLDQFITFETSGNSISWTSVDFNPATFVIYKNGTEIITGNWISGTPIFLSIDGLSTDTYFFNITVYDFAGNWVSDLIIVIIHLDLLNPLIDSIFDVTLEYGENTTIIWNVADELPDKYNITIDDILIKQGSWSNGTINFVFDIPLNVGMYTIVITINDLAGNTASDTITLFIQDTINPSLNESPSDLSLNLGSTGNSISWMSIDLNPANYTIDRDGVSIITGNWSSGIPILVTIDGLGVGSYVFTVTISDLVRNSITDSVTITVVDLTIPIINNPIDLIYELGSTNNTINWIVGDNDPGIYNITIDASLLKTDTTWINGTISINVDSLSYGTHIVHISLYDLSGNVVENIVNINVIDTVSPTIDSPLDFSYKVGTTGNEITWIVSDLNPYEYIVTLNNVNYVSNTLWSSGSISIEVDNLNLGTNIFLITVYDKGGNMISDSVTVIVEEVETSVSQSSTSPISTTTIQSSTTQAISEESTIKKDNGSDNGFLSFGILQFIFPLLFIGFAISYIRRKLLA